MFTLGSFFITCMYVEVPHIFGLLFSTVKVMHEF
jgi:hypothetical protein